VALVAGQALLEFTQLKQLACVDQARKLADQGNVLGHIPAKLAELGVILDKSGINQQIVSKTWFQSSGWVLAYRFMSATVSILLA